LMTMGKCGCQGQTTWEPLPNGPWAPWLCSSQNKGTLSPFCVL